MNIDRHFTKSSTTYDRVQMKTFACSLKAADGSNVFAMSGVEAPSHWSQTAVNIMAQKYFRRAGVPSVTVPDPDGIVLDPKGRACPEWLRPRIPGPNATFAGETSFRDVSRRLTCTWGYWGWISGMFDGDAEAVGAFVDEAEYSLAMQMAAPNSPQFFNTGLHWAYGIDGPAEGHAYVDPATKRVVMSDSKYRRPAPHACFILSVKDDLVGEGGIMDLLSREARLFKTGSGTGSNFSSIRGENERLSGGGTSSGLLSFLRIGDRAAGAIKSGGTTRRAAKMVVVDADHPDIEAIVDWKVGEENKVASLVAGSRLCHDHAKRVMEGCRAGGTFDGDRKTNPGLMAAVAAAHRAHVPANVIDRAITAAGRGETYDFATFTTDWDSEAYNTVSGQNSNNSVRVTNALMEAIDADGDWNLIRRTDGGIAKTLKARALWDRIGYAAWACADPGIQYDTTINEWHTVPELGRILASNPCSEYLSIDDTACNLASLNLIKFFKEGLFDEAGFTYTVMLWTLILDISMEMAQFPSREVAWNSYLLRNLGLGYANLGGTLMMLGIPYDSEEGRSICSAVTSIMTATAYQTSSYLAEHLGAFPAYAENTRMMEVVRNHAVAAGAVDGPFVGVTCHAPVWTEEHLPERFKGLWRLSQEIWTDVLERGARHGFRNSQTTVLAPTGTISFLMDCDTTGIEPEFSMLKYKTLAGGGSIRIMNTLVPSALEALGYSTRQMEAISNYVRGTGKLSGAARTRLREKGFDDVNLDAIESTLASGMTFRSAMNVRAFEREFLTAAVGITEAQHSDARFDLAAWLGFSEGEAAAITAEAAGNGELEGAPFLDPAHLAVFDCANARGTRVLSWEAHVRMMAAAQPFITGAISKTINMPNSATMEECQAAYELSARLGIKAAALYRDGSKLSQPLMNALIADVAEFESEGTTAETLAARMASASVASKPAGRPPRSPKEARRSAPLQRYKLADARPGTTTKMKIAGQNCYVQTGNYPDGSLGEIFVTMHKEGAAFRSAMNQWAIAISLGLQYGVPLEEFVEAFVGTNFEPSGIVQNSDHIKFARSIPDLIMRHLAISYLGDVEKASEGFKAIPVRGAATDAARARIYALTCGTPADDEDRPAEDEAACATSAEDAMNLPMAQGFVAHAAEGTPDGSFCPSCGGMLISTGTCRACPRCGSSEGGCG